MTDDARRRAEDQPAQTPPIDLIARRCWVPACRYLAAFRDGAGWWWCYEHRDWMGGWGVEEIASYDEVYRKATYAVAQAVAEAIRRDGAEDQADHEATVAYWREQVAQAIKERDAKWMLKIEEWAEWLDGELTQAGYPIHEATIGRNGKRLHEVLGQDIADIVARGRRMTRE